MKRFLVCAVALLALGFVAVAAADEKAATDQLPAALAAVGGGEHVVTKDAAQKVRGQNYQMFTQTKDFNVWGGVAVGTTNLMEGVFGQFKFTQVVPGGPGLDPSSLSIEGSFGGLQGVIGVTTDGGLAFNMQGKAFQETMDFSGLFSQSFSQSYKVPLLNIGK